MTLWQYMDGSEGLENQLLVDLSCSLGVCLSSPKPSSPSHFLKHCSRHFHKYYLVSWAKTYLDANLWGLGWPWATSQLKNLLELICKLTANTWGKFFTILFTKNPWSLNCGKRLHLRCKVLQETFAFGRVYILNSYTSLRGYQGWLLGLGPKQIDDE